MGEVTDAVLFLLDHGGVNGVNLAVDGGWLLRWGDPLDAGSHRARAERGSVTGHRSACGTAKQHFFWPVVAVQGLVVK